jgi:hypothetical protein
MQTEKQPSRNLKDIVGAPFPFKLKDGTVLGLDDWTLASESWAKATFGSMQKFNDIMFKTVIKADATESDMDGAVEASLKVAAHQLDEASYRLVDERRADGKTTEEFLASNLKYDDFKTLCHAIIDMITASFPEGWEEDQKKKLLAQRIAQTKKPTRR